ncbi:hypothetical protein N9C96_01395 [bacterium]|nr:hypothetical protein [bacterium]
MPKFGLFWTELSLSDLCGFIVTNDKAHTFGTRFYNFHMPLQDGPVAVIGDIVHVWFVVPGPVAVKTAP